MNKNICEDCKYRVDDIHNSCSFDKDYCVYDEKGKLLEIQNKLNEFLTDRVAFTIQQEKYIKIDEYLVKDIISLIKEAENNV